MNRDPARSYEPIDEEDLARLGRIADAECVDFFGRNPHIDHWRRQLRFVALASQVVRSTTCEASAGSGTWT